jgi:hypothetical protein
MYAKAIAPEGFVPPFETVKEAVNVTGALTVVWLFCADELKPMAVLTAFTVTVAWALLVV